MRTIPLLLLSALLLASPGSGAPDKSVIPPVNGPAERITQAERRIREGSLQEALTRFVEPTIAEFEKEFAGRTERIYCARDEAEKAHYLKASAAKGEPAVVADQAYAHAYFLKGYILVDWNDFRAAGPFLTKAAELSPGNAQYLCELGHLFQTAKDWAKSMETFDRGAEGARLFSGKADHSSDLRRALRGKGYCLIELGRLDEAEQLYHQCLELDPGDQKATNELRYIADLRAKQDPTK